MEKLIRLGIAVDYPVHWTLERVLRDLIQNFYDSIGVERFGKEFRYSFRQGAAEQRTGKQPFLRRSEATWDLTMQTKGHPFHYEWLVYIGGSTKTESRGTQIGKYGEGFKICMLNLLDMGISDITMHSQGWRLRPCIYQEEIDLDSVPMLGYRLEEAEDDNVTSLVIRGIPERFENFLQEGLLHFFYPENPLFGELLCEGKGYRIYRKGRKMEIPCRQRGLDFKGILYLDYLARGRLPIPFFVLLTGVRCESIDSRKRRTMRDFEAYEYLYRLGRLMSPEDSLELLFLLEKDWNRYPRFAGDMETLYYFICQLVRNVASSEAASESFRGRIACPLSFLERKTMDRKRNTLIEQAGIWAKEDGRDGRIRLVNPVFRLLGASSLVEEFQESALLRGCRPLDPGEAEMVDFLFGLYREVIPKAMQTQVPEVLVARDASGGRPDPLSFADRDIPAGSRVRYQRYALRRLVLLPGDFRTDSFERTLMLVIDAMMHAFGSSRSDRVNTLFTYVGAFLIEHADTILSAGRRWENMAERLAQREQ